MGFETKLRCRYLGVYINFLLQMFSKHSFVNATDSIIGMQIDDKRVYPGQNIGESPINITSLSLFSRMWSITPLNNREKVHPSASLSSDESSVAMYFRASPYKSIEGNGTESCRSSIVFECATPTEGTSIDCVHNIFIEKV